MRRLKILFINDGYPTRQQPNDSTFVLDRAKAVKLYDDVAVLHYAGWDSGLKGSWQIVEQVGDSFTEGIPVFRVSYRRLVIPRVGLSIPKTAVMASLLAIYQAVRYITARGFRPDIVHAHRYRVGVPAILVSRLCRSPFVVTGVSEAVLRGSVSEREISKIQRVYNSARFVLAISYAMQRSLESYGIKARFRVIPNPVDTALFYCKPNSRTGLDQKRLLFVGRLDHVKGVSFLLNALGELKRYRSDWHLQVVGDGPERERYQGLAADLGLVNEVTFYGSKPKREVAEFMRQADLLVLPSLYETFGRVAAEALAAGTPVLATNYGGQQDIVRDDVGVLVAPGDVGALRHGLQYMLDHLERFTPESLSRYASAHFSPEVVGQRLHEIYEECMEGDAN